MKKQDLQNEQLDEIGRKLLETARASDAELDRIVGSPKLFDGIKAGIKAEQQQRGRRSKTSFGDWRNLLVWNWQKTGAALAVLMFVALAAFGVIVLTKQDSTPALAEKIAPPEINLPGAPVKISPPVKTPEALPEIVKTKNSARENRPSFRKAAFKTEIAAAPKSKPRRKNSVKRQPEITPEGEFYALNYAGISNEAGENLRLVRTELSPAALFALGVNLPIENESAKIKTDLLVGADGVAKAIRFVK